ncbi:hypothetical protein SOI71_13670 [Acinetobacter pittii]|uniref:hypothetical protein n=1 Tax=Acinetobacter pittii TaxID=48296 RepID=UPI002A748CD8|nr:hypothetical protein [Acinetobacter pittii]WPP76386.1 hypothetical protein SOI71_13670 [Acinetobacter pittii]
MPSVVHRPDDLARYFRHFYYPRLVVHRPDDLAINEIQSKPHQGVVHRIDDLEMWGNVEN